MALKPIEIILRAKDEASSVFEGLRSRAATIGVAIAGYFGFTAFSEAVKGAADLEAMLSEVQSVTSATADDMVRLRTAAEDAGATTKYTATQAAEALGNLARAGLNANQAIEALPATLQLAQAGGVDLGRAAEFITKSVMGMGDSFDQSGRYADVLAKGANASNTSVTGLAEALSYAAPTAATLKLSLEDTVAIIGKFADAGIDASRAGTALNSILSQFADPASTFKRALSDIGITTTDFNVALGQLAAAGPRGQKAIAAVGLEAGPALKAMLNQGIGALDELRNKLKDASGSAAETAAVMNNNLRGSLDGLASAWETVKNALATPVLPVLKAAVDSLTAALGDAVKSGTVARWGEAIKAGFESAITWGKAFAAQVDFEKMGQTMRGYADRVGEAFTTIQIYATNAGNIVQTVWGTMSAGANVVLGVIYKLGQALAVVVAGMQNDLALLMDGLSKVTFGAASDLFKRQADEMRLSANATSAAARALGEQSAASFAAVVDGAEMARNGWAGLTGSATTGQAAMQAGQAVIAKTAQDLADMGTKAIEAGNAAKLAAAQQAEAAGLAADKVAALRAEYQAAVDAGNWQLAAERLTALASAASHANTSLADLDAQAQTKAAAIAAAFQAMGIKTKAELEDMAATSASRFALIKDSGQASADGIAAAWKKMAEDSIAANGGLATETLKAQAAMYGLRVEVDAVGKATVTSMATGVESMQQYAQAVRQTSDAVELLNTQYKLSSDYSERQVDLLNKELDARQALLDLKQREIDLENRRRGVDKEGYGLNTAGQRAVGSALSLNEAVKQAVAQGLDESQALEIAKRNYEAGGTKRFGTATMEVAGGVYSNPFWEQVTEALDKQLLSKRTGGNQLQSAPASTPASTSHTVTINLNGQSTRVNTASAGDATALAQVLAGLQSAASRSA